MAKSAAPRILVLTFVNRSPGEDEDRNDTDREKSGIPHHEHLPPAAWLAEHSSPGRSRFNTGRKVICCSKSREGTRWFSMSPPPRSLQHVRSKIPARVCRRNSFIVSPCQICLRVCWVTLNEFRRQTRAGIF